MDVVFYPSTHELKIDTSEVGAYQSIVRAIVETEGQTLKLTGVQMSLIVEVDGETKLDIFLPPKGVKFKRTSSRVLSSVSVSWKPFQTVKVTAWMRDTHGQEQTVTETFETPRPDQPYPSWVWDGSQWEPPVPQPAGSGWLWDEEHGDWALHINNPSVRALQELPGVGRAYAEAIRERLPVQSLDELTEVDGISPELIETWSDKYKIRV